MVAGAALPGSHVEGLLGCLQQLVRDRGYRPHGESPGRIGHPALSHHTDVDRQDVPAEQLVGPRYSVDDHRVRRGADRAREAAIALEGWLRTLGANELLS